MIPNITTVMPGKVIVNDLVRYELGDKGWLFIGDLRTKRAVINGYGYAEEGLAILLGVNENTLHYDENETNDTVILFNLPGTRWNIIGEIARYTLTVLVYNVENDMGELVYSRD